MHVRIYLALINHGKFMTIQLDGNKQCTVIKLFLAVIVLFRQQRMQ